MNEFKLAFNEKSKRYGHFNEYDQFIDITSGEFVKLNYNGLIFETDIEHNGKDYYMTEYKDIELKKLVGVAIFFE